MLRPAITIVWTVSSFVSFELVVATAEVNVRVMFVLKFLVSIPQGLIIVNWFRPLLCPVLSTAVLGSSYLSINGVLNMW